MKRRAAWLIAFTVACALAALLLPRVPQAVEYHDFADHRALFGIANFLDVASNSGFLFAGVAGLLVVAVRRRAFELGIERWPYAAFFVGLVLTAIGSAYYHVAPDNARLVWDRLPMTIAFAGLLSSQIADRISVRAGVALLVPMIAIGAASVIYWGWTERSGEGNVLPYAIVQGYAAVVLLMVTMLYSSRYSRGRDIYYVLGWYVVSKILEALDMGIFDLGHAVSGHTLKHVAAAVSGFVACWMLAKRELVRPGAASG